MLSDSTILISGGEDDEYNSNKLSSAYLLKLAFDEDHEDKTKIREIHYITSNVNAYPIAVSRSSSASCEGRSIICGGMDSNAYTSAVYEYDRGEWRPLPPLNKARRNADSCYYQKTLFVLGGLGNADNRLNDIEMLHLDTTTTASQWKTCKAILPVKLGWHCVTQFQKHIIVTGGLVEGGSSKQVYQGTVSNEGNDVEWHELPPMNAARQVHMAINYFDKYLVVMGLSLIHI